MSEELNRINPTVVEGAEDVYGAEMDNSLSGDLRRMKRMSRMRAEGILGNLIPDMHMMSPDELRRERMKNRNMKDAQGYDDKMDESLGMRHRGRHSQSMKDRRDEASAMDKMHSKMGRKYDDVKTMDAQGYDDKMDESLGMRHRGRHSQSMKDRRDEASAMDKMHSKMGRKYDDVMTMDRDAEFFPDGDGRNFGNITADGQYDPLGANAEGFDAERTYKRDSRGRFSRKSRRGASRASRTTGDDPDFDEAKADRNKDGVISEWERAVGNAVAKGIRTNRESKGAETFEANEEAVEQTDANMVNEGTLDAFYGGGAKVSVSDEGIVPTSNPSVDEAFNVGNLVGINPAAREEMNVNPSVEANYGAESDIVDTVRELTGKAGFRIGGGTASAIVVAVAAIAGYQFAKR